MHFDLLTMYTAPDGGQCSTTQRLTNCYDRCHIADLLGEFLHILESSPDSLPTHGESPPEELQSTGMTAWWQFCAWAQQRYDVSVECQQDTMVDTNRETRPDVVLVYNETFPIEQAMRRV